LPFEETRKEDLMDKASTLRVLYTAGVLAGSLDLGERRAETVKNYLAAEGIAADRISTISYGAERPFVLGHDENAWK
jgi:outer membrane protein OmpA-like peptidoglycan-associated protein